MHFIVIDCDTYFLPFLDLKRVSKELKVKQGSETVDVSTPSYLELRLEPFMITPGSRGYWENCSLPKDIIGL